MVHGVHNSGSDIQRLQQQQQEDDLRADLDRDRPRTPSQNGSRAGEWVHDSLSQGFSANRLSARSSQYLNRRVASHPEPSVHSHDQDDTGAEANTLRRIVQSQNTELNALRQELQAMKQLEDGRTNAKLDQERRDFQLATKLQKMEDERAESELHRTASQAKIGYDFIRDLNRAAERLT